MSWIMRTFFRGLVTILPVALSVYLIVWFFLKAEILMKDFLGWVWPGLHYVTGVGICFGVVIIFILGLIMSHVIIQKLFVLVENFVESVPIVKSIYTAIKDLINFFTPDEDGKGHKVVVVGRPDEPNDRIGFLTNENPQIPGLEGRVAVYMPMSYQIGGYTAFVPKSWVREIDMGAEEAMRSALTAWMPNT